jgi:hypothetical protein
MGDVNDDKGKVEEGKSTSTSEIDDMNKILTDFEVPEDKDSDGTSAPFTTSVITTAPSTSAPVEDPMKSLKDELDSIKQKLADLSVGKVEEKKVVADDTPLEDIDFLGSISIDELASDPTKFKQVLNDVYKKAIETAKKEILKSNEQLLRSVPDAINYQVETKAKLKKLSEDFYTSNKDLEPFKKVVAVVFEELASKNPGKSFDEIIKGVAPEVRSRLNLVKKATENKQSSLPLPKAKGAGRNSQQKPNTNSLEDEISKMEKALNS